MILIGPERDRLPRWRNASKVLRSRTRQIRPKASGGPSDGGPAELGARLASTCGAGSRAASLGDGCWAGMFASPLDASSTTEPPVAGGVVEIRATRPLRHLGHHPDGRMDDRLRATRRASSAVPARLEPRPRPRQPHDASQRSGTKKPALSRTFSLRSAALCAIVHRVLRSPSRPVGARHPSTAPNGCAGLATRPRAVNPRFPQLWTPLWT